MSVFNDYLEENVVITNYDPITGMEFQGIDTSSIIEMCADLRESYMYMSGKMYIIEVMEHFNMLPVNEGVIKTSKDFFKFIIDKLKAFLAKIGDFFKNIFAKMEVMFTTNGKTFLDKYSEGIKRSLNTGKAEWIEFNERYLLSKKEHEDIFNKIDGVINFTVGKFTTIKNDAIKIANEAKTSQHTRDEKGNVDDEKVAKTVNRAYDYSLHNNEFSTLIKEIEKDIASRLLSGAESFDDVKEIFKSETNEKDKDNKNMLDANMINKFLSYCNDHVSKDLIELKNTQTRFTTLINNTQNSIRDIDNKFGMVDDSGKLSSIRQACNWFMSTLSFLQELNAKRVSTRTQTFNYYISVLKRYTKKNYKIITGTEAPKKGKASEYKNKIADKVKSK